MGFILRNCVITTVYICYCSRSGNLVRIILKCMLRNLDVKVGIGLNWFEIDLWRDLNCRPLYMARNLLLIFRLLICESGTCCVESVTILCFSVHICERRIRLLGLFFLGSWKTWQPMSQLFMNTNPCLWSCEPYACNAPTFRIKFLSLCVSLFRVNPSEPEVCATQINWTWEKNSVTAAGAW
jgi:hypothetical protein